MSFSRSTARLRLGVIGCGSILRLIYAPIFRSLEKRIDIQAVCDINHTAATEAAEVLGAPHVFGHAHDLIEYNGLDAVVVLTAEKFNAPVAGAVLRAGLPVYLEKPPAVSVNELRELIAVETDSRSIAFTAFNRRHTPIFTGVRLKNSGGLRRVMGTMGRRGRPLNSFPYTAIHLVDSARYFTGLEFDPRTFQVQYERDLGDMRIVLRGKLGPALVRLTFSPNGEEHSERLAFESSDERLELHFPNPEGAIQEGALFRSGQWEIPSHVSSHLETMGYAEAFRCFLNHVERGDLRTTEHRLARALGTIEVMEALFQHPDEMLREHQSMPEEMLAEELAGKSTA